VGTANRASLLALLEWLDPASRTIESYVVTGSRTWWDWRTMWHVLSFMPATAIQFNGCAVGADCLAGAFWRSQGFRVRDFPANWTALGKQAGSARNRLMMESMPNLALVFLHHAGPSRGTRDAMNAAAERGIPIFKFHQAA
jgi:hypothetical protein